MKILAVFVLLLAVANSFELHSHLQSYHNSLQHAHSELDNHFNALSQQLEALQVQHTSNFQTQASAPCEAALTAYGSKSLDCLSAMMDAMMGNSTTVAPFCASNGCNDQIANASKQVEQACTAEEMKSRNFTSTSIEAFSMICVKEGDTYCWPEFMKAQKTLSQGITAAGLDAVCSPCTRKILVVSQAFMDKDSQGSGPSVVISSMETICLKSQGQYCMIFSQANQNTNFYRTLCENQCMQISMRFQTPGSDFGPFFKQLCLMDGSQPCITKVTTYLAGPPCGAANLTGNVCPAGCSSSLNTAFKAMGCCSPTVVAFAEMTTMNQKSNFTRAVGFVKNTCNVDIPVSCSSTFNSSVDFSVTVRNLKYSYYQSNQSLVVNALKSDIVVFAVVDESDVSVVSASEYIAPNGGLNGVRFQVRITLPTVTQASNIRETVTSNLGSSSIIPLRQMDSLPVAARYDTVAAVSIDSASSSISAPTSTSSAVRSSLNFVTVAFMILAVLLFI